MSRKVGGKKCIPDLDNDIVRKMCVCIYCMSLCIAFGQVLTKSEVYIYGDLRLVVKKQALGDAGYRMNSTAAVTRPAC